MAIYDVLTTIQSRCEALDNVTTCKIGLEPNLTAADYPIVRIVPSVLRNNTACAWRVDAEVIIYYGELSYAFNDGGIEAQYEWLLAMDVTIRNIIEVGDGWRAKWLDTVLDEDRLPGYKIFASRYLITA
jgi:hypothetical protein